MILAVPVIDPATAELEKSTPVDRVLAHGGCRLTSFKLLQISAAPSMSVEKWTDALIGQSSPLIVRTHTPFGRSYPVKLRLCVVAGGEIELAPRILYSEAFPI